MPNYKMKFGVSKVAQLLEIDRKLIKDWSFHFSEYLSLKANPDKGDRREYTSDDLCTLSYISMHWEENPDFENIRYGLNSGSQFEYPYTEIAVEATPIFKEFSEEFVNSNAWIIGGMAQIQSKISLAYSYKIAGDILVQHGIEDSTSDYTYPAIYNYRHATELYLKYIIKDRIIHLPKNGNIHDLKTLYSEFKTLLFELFDTIPPRWFENIINAFDDFDPSGTTFRYGTFINKNEAFIDLHHLKNMMNNFSKSIHNIDKEISRINKRQ